MTDRRKRLALLAAILGTFVAALDASVVNVALPAIESDLGGGLAGQQWVSNAYLLTLGSLILVGGSLADLYGERRIFTIGVAGFGIVSVVCAMAPSIEVLVAGRALQGVFGALLTPSALAVIVVELPARRARRGDRLVDGVGRHRVRHRAAARRAGSSTWRPGAGSSPSTCPSSIATVIIVRIAVAARHGREPRTVRLDFLGAALCALGLAGPVFALIRQPSVGWGSPEVVDPAGRGPGDAGRVRRPRGPHARTRCCRWGCSGGATSPSATSRRSRCTAGSAR